MITVFSACILDLVYNNLINKVATLQLLYYRFMNIHETREKHYSFHYDEYNIDQSNGVLQLDYKFTISPDITFKPRVEIPLLDGKSLDVDTVNNFAFNLGMIEAISYWKSTCSPEFIVEAGELSTEQVNWWHDLFIHGLGEFYYRNQIDFTGKNFLNIRSSVSAPVHSTDIKHTENIGDLILIGGGKDSAVTLQLLAGLNPRNGAMMLNPSKASFELIDVAELSNTIVVKRIIDKKLLDLNEQGYLNGHTPFSAYLSFLSLFVANLHGYENVIVSNEASAGEENLTYRGHEINHQYSKSYRYEKLFREYQNKFITTNTQYFSFLRPLSELQIAALFSESSEYDKAFCSCNVGRSNYWCGNCPKCAFVYLSLSPFLEPDRIKAIFGEDDYFDKPSIKNHILDLVGLGSHKPFECVGTVDESRLAILLSINKYQKYGLEVPSFLLELSSKLGLGDDDLEEMLSHIRSDWDSKNFLPSQYESLLKDRLARLPI